MKLILPDSIRSKKNSKRIFGRGRFKKVLPSDAYMEWEEEARRAIVLQLPAWYLAPTTKNVSIKATIYYKGQRPDLSGCFESIGDCLESVVYVNDKQIVSWDGSRLYHDLKNPRTEVIIESI